ASATNIANVSTIGFAAIIFIPQMIQRRPSICSRVLATSNQFRQTEAMMKEEQLNELLYQSLETELGGVQIYEAAVRCAINDELKEEWEEYLEQTRTHVQIVQDIFSKLGLDPETETPGRKVVRHLGESLLQAIEMARSAGEPEAAQVV